jgi:hypothetical protein
VIGYGFMVRSCQTNELRSLTPKIGSSVLLLTKLARSLLLPLSRPETLLDAPLDMPELLVEFIAVVFSFGVASGRLLITK